MFTEEWLKEYQQRTGKGVHGETNAQPVKKRSKYGNVKTETDGFVFDSKHEAKVYEEYRMMGLAHEIRGFGKQVVFYLPGNIKYIADFVILTNDGGMLVVDAKSDATRRDKVYRIKKKLMKDTFGIEVLER